MVTVHVESAQSRWSPGTVATLALATAGLGLNLRAWILLGSQLHDRFDVAPAHYFLLVGLPLLVAALARLPVGVLTDRYGARVMFPMVSLAAAASVIGLGLADSLPGLVVAGGAAGIAGTAFVVGGSLLSRTLPYGRRGLALGVFCLGPVLGVITSATSRGLDPGGRRAAVVLGVLLIGYAGLTALVLRDPITGPRVRTPVRSCLEMVRLASGTSLSLLYALALGGLVAIAVYLPVYLATVFGLGWFHALTVTGAVVGLGSLARLVGGWWTDRRPTVGLLKVSYTVAAGLCLVGAMAPRLWWLTVSLIAVISTCYGLASGALLALIGKAARPDSVGAVMGVTGAAAAFGALLPPFVLAGVDHLRLSSATGWVLLAAALFAAALYVRSQGLRVGLGLAVRFEPGPTETAMTITVVGGWQTQLGAAAVVARLAELATSDELVVIYGSDEQKSDLGTNVIVAGLRYRLPRHRVVAVDIGHHAWTRRRLAYVSGEIVESGTVPVVVALTADLRDLAAELSSDLRADRVLMMSYSPARGAGLHEVWRRASPARGS